MQRPQIDSPFEDFTIVSDSSVSENENFDEIVTLEKEAPK